MNYDLRMEICRRIRHLEYDPKESDEVKRDIASLTEFTQSEKDLLYCFADKFEKKQEVNQGIAGVLQKIFPYAVAAALGYGAHVAQEKLGRYVEEGKMKAREDFAGRNEKSD